MSDTAIRWPSCGNFLHLDVICTDSVHVYKCQTIGVPGFIGEASGKTREWSLDHSDHFYARVLNGQRLRRVDVVAANKKEGWYTWKLHVEAA